MDVACWFMLIVAELPLQSDVSSLAAAHRLYIGFTLGAHRRLSAE